MKEGTANHPVRSVRYHESKVFTYPNITHHEFMSNFVNYMYIKHLALAISDGLVLGKKLWEFFFCFTHRLRLFVSLLQRRLTSGVQQQQILFTMRHYLPDLARHYDLRIDTVTLQTSTERWTQNNSQNYTSEKCMRYQPSLYLELDESKLKNQYKRTMEEHLSEKV